MMDVVSSDYNEVVSVVSTSNSAMYFNGAR